MFLHEKRHFLGVDCSILLSAWFDLFERVTSHVKIGRRSGDISRYKNSFKGEKTQSTGHLSTANNCCGNQEKVNQLNSIRTEIVDGKKKHLSWKTYLKRNRLVNLNGMVK